MRIAGGRWEARCWLLVLLRVEHLFLEFSLLVGLDSGHVVDVDLVGGFED